MRLQRVPEEDHEIDPALDDGGADLLVAAERAAHEAADPEAELGGQERAGGAGGVEIVLAEGPSVVLCPVEQVRLAVVVRDERDLLAHAHPGSKRIHGISEY